MRTEEEIKKDILEISENNELSFGYQSDVIDILNWVLGLNNTFDGLP